MEPSSQRSSILLRLGQVSWWVGALTMVGASITGVLATFNSSVAPQWGWLGLPLFAAIITGPAWALSYVLAGSFWRAPR